MTGSETLLVLWRPATVLPLTVLATLAAAVWWGSWRRAFAIGLIVLGAAWLSWGLVVRVVVDDMTAIASARAAGYEPVWLAAVLVGVVGIAGSSGARLRSD